jgi:hypothetical protein
MEDKMKKQRFFLKAAGISLAKVAGISLALVMAFAMFAGCENTVTKTVTVPGDPVPGTPGGIVTDKTHPFSATTANQLNALVKLGAKSPIYVTGNITATKDIVLADGQSIVIADQAYADAQPRPDGTRLSLVGVNTQVKLTIPSGIRLTVGSGATLLVGELTNANKPGLLTIEGGAKLTVEGGAYLGVTAASQVIVNKLDSTDSAAVSAALPDSGLTLLPGANVIAVVEGTLGSQTLIAKVDENTSAGNTLIAIEDGVAAAIAPDAVFAASDTTAPSQEESMTKVDVTTEVADIADGNPARITAVWNEVSGLLGTGGVESVTYTGKETVTTSLTLTKTLVIEGELTLKGTNGKITGTGNLVVASSGKVVLAEESSVVGDVTVTGTKSSGLVDVKAVYTLATGDATALEHITGTGVQVAVNQEGLTLDSATRDLSPSGKVSIKLGGTVTSNPELVRAWFDEKGSQATGTYAIATIKGIFNTEAKKAGTTLKNYNPSWWYYKGAATNDTTGPLLEHEATTAPTAYPTLWLHATDPAKSYNWKKSASTRDDDLTLILWSGASTKEATLEITPAAPNTAYTIIVDWSGLTITQPAFTRAANAGTYRVTGLSSDSATLTKITDNNGTEVVGPEVTYSVADAALLKIFNAVYTPNAPGSTADTFAAIETGKTAIAYDAAVSAAVLKLFYITIGTNSDGSGDLIEIKGSMKDNTVFSAPDADNILVIDVGLPGTDGNTDIPTFKIPVQGLGDLDADPDNYDDSEIDQTFGGVRLRVNKGAYLVIDADNGSTASEGTGYVGKGAGNPCPTGKFNGGCVEVLEGGKLRDSAYEGYPLGDDATILLRYGSTIVIGKEDRADNLTEDTYNAYFKDNLIGPATAEPKIQWDSNVSQPNAFIELRPGELVLSAKVTVKKLTGIIYSVWFVNTRNADNTADLTTAGLTIDASGSGLFAANDTKFKFYGQNGHTITITNGSLSKCFVDSTIQSTQDVFTKNGQDITITNGGATKDGSPVTSTPANKFTGIGGYLNWAQTSPEPAAASIGRL